MTANNEVLLTQCLFLINLSTSPLRFSSWRIPKCVLKTFSRVTSKQTISLLLQLPQFSVYFYESSHKFISLQKVGQLLCWIPFSAGHTPMCLTFAFFLISSNTVKIGRTFASNLGKLRHHSVPTEFTFCVALSDEKGRFSIKIYIAR